MSNSRFMVLSTEQEEAVGIEPRTSVTSDTHDNSDDDFEVVPDNIDGNDDEFNPVKRRVHAPKVPPEIRSLMTWFTEKVGHNLSQFSKEHPDVTILISVKWDDPKDCPGHLYKACKHPVFRTFLKEMSGKHCEGRRIQCIRDASNRSTDLYLMM